MEPRSNSVIIEGLGPIQTEGGSVLVLSDMSEIAVVFVRLQEKACRAVDGVPRSLPFLYLFSFHSPDFVL